jgi:hypothetical protein
MERRDRALGAPARRSSGGLLITSAVLVLAGVVLMFSVVGAVVGLPVTFAGVVLGLYAWFKRG